MRLSIVALFGLCVAAMAQTPLPGGGSGGGGMGGNVTSVGSGCGLAGGPITTTGTLRVAPSTRAATGTTDTILSSDCGDLVTESNAAAVAVTLPQATGAFTSTWWFDIVNLGVGTATITPTTSTINGAATLVLTTGQGAHIVSDGTNYTAVLGQGSASGVSSVVISGTASKITVSGTCTITTTGTCTITIPDNVTLVNPTTTGILSAGGATRTAPIKIDTSAPGTCTVGDFFFDSDAVAGHNLFMCTATNTFTQVIGTGGGGTGCVPAGSADQVLVDDGAGECDSTGVEIDSSDNITTPGRISTGVGGSEAGAVGFTQGTACTPGTTEICEYAPASVTSYGIVKPSTVGSTGAVLVSVSGTTATESHGTVPLAAGGTNRSSSWTASRCVQVNSGGTALEPAAAACGSGGGGGDPFDLSSQSGFDRFQGNTPKAGTISTGMYLGDWDWYVVVQGTAPTISPVLTNKAGGIPGGTTVAAASGSSSGIITRLHEQTGYTSAFLTSFTTAKLGWFFTTPSDDAAGVFYFAGLNDENGDDVLWAAFYSGAHTNWVVEVKEDATPGTGCTASAPPTAGTYYIFELDFNGTSTVTAHLYSSTSKYEVTSDLFTACTVTLPTSTVGMMPLFWTGNNAGGSTPATTMQINEFAYKFDQ